MQSKLMLVVLVGVWGNFAVAGEVAKGDASFARVISQESRQSVSEYIEELGLQLAFDLTSALERNKLAMGAEARNPPPLQSMPTQVLGARLVSPGEKEAQPSGVVGWSDGVLILVRKALNNHPSIRQGKAISEAGKSDVTAAKWQRAPTPSYSREYAGSGYKDRYQNVLRLQQPLWTGGQITAGIELAEARAKSLDYSLKDSEQELVLRVAEAWGHWVRAEQRHQQQLGMLREHQELFEMIGRRVDQRIASITDKDLARTRLVAVQGMARQAEIAVRQYRSTLEQLVGEAIPESARNTLEGRPPLTVTRTALIEALENGPLLIKARAEIEVVQAELDVKKASLSPQVFARAEKYWGAHSEQRFYIGVQAALEGGVASTYSIQAQRRRLQAAEEAVEAVRKEAFDRGNAEYANYESALARYETAKGIVDDSISVLDSYQRQFIAGRRNWLDVLNMVREAYQARFDLVTADVDLRVAAFRLYVLASNSGVGKGSLK